MSTQEYFESLVRTDAFCPPDFETHKTVSQSGIRWVTFHYLDVFPGSEPHAAVSVLVVPSGRGYGALPVVAKGASR